MYNIKVTWQGPADKLLINGKFFKLAFLNLSEASKWAATLPGLQTSSTLPQTDPTSISRIFIFDTEANGIASGIGLPGREPANVISDHAGLSTYIDANDLSFTIERYNS